MPLVTDIQELKDRQTLEDENHRVLMRAAQQEHPEFNSNHFPSPTVQHTRDLDACATCQEPQYDVLNTEKGIYEPMCRGCINALKIMSLVHRSTRDICIECNLHRDSYGVINFATHVGHRIVDETVTNPDGSTQVLVGLETLIAAGRVIINDDGVVRITD